MTSDDQYFLDILSSISTDVRKFIANAVEQVFDSTDRAADAVASSLKGAARQVGPWIGLRRPPEPPPVAVPLSYYERAADWLSRHRAVTAAVIAFCSTGAIYIYTQRRYHGRKRRARRAANGARREVVVVAGPPSSPITKSLASDLERRGFIVYILVSTTEEESLVQGENRTDIRPFHMNVLEQLSTQQAMTRFNNLLTTQHHAFAGAAPHDLKFTGLIIAPDLQYPSGPIETLSLELWSDAINAKMLRSIATAQAFLPTVCEFKARVLVLTPSIVSSLKPPFHGVENTVVGALEGFTTTLRRELSTLGIGVCHLKLGSFDVKSSGYGSPRSNHSQQPISGARSYAWPPIARVLYAQNFVNQSRVAEAQGVFGHTVKGSSLRELHYAVFDALTVPRPRKVCRIGRGSVAYDMIGAWVPSGIVGWMLGIRRVSLEEMAGPSQLQL